MQCTEKKYFMYFWRMKTKRLSPGIPRLHNSSMCSRRIRFTTIANARFSMVIWDSLSSSHEFFRPTAPYFEALARRSLRSLQNQSHSGRRSRWWSHRPQNSFPELSRQQDIESTWQYPMLEKYSLRLRRMFSSIIWPRPPAVLNKMWVGKVRLTSRLISPTLQHLKSFPTINAFILHKLSAKSITTQVIIHRFIIQW